MRCGRWIPGVVAAALMLSAPALASGQIVAPSGRTLFNQGVLLRSFIRFDALGANGGDGRSEGWSNVYALVWGAAPHLSLSLVTPIVARELPGASSRTVGSGDTSLFARYDLVRRNVTAGYTRLAAEVGLRLPTGGAFGSDSTDLVGGMILSHVRDPNWWVGDVQITEFGESGGGRLWRVDLAYLRRVVPRDGVGVPMVLAVLELNWETLDSARGAVDRSVLWLSPGVEWLLNQRLVLELSVPIAILEDVPSVAAEPRYSVIVGMRLLF